MGVADKNHRWGLPPLSTILYHFGTSGVSVATATSVTHPLGSDFFFLFSKVIYILFQML